MLTTDIFLTQFVAWAIYFFWRSWPSVANAECGAGSAKFFLWHLAGWTTIALGFLTKGPIALAIPLVALAALMIYRRRNLPRKKLLFGGLVAGLLVFFALAAPWFLVVFQRVPESAHYMILGQAAGHLLGTTIKNRPGGPFYFFGILAVGLLPWTILLGWLWRWPHWRGLADRQRDGWLLLNVWAIFTFALFTLSHAKLPAYILPVFPALAVMLAWRFFGGDGAREGVPALARQILLASSLLLPAIFPVVLIFAFHDPLPAGLKWQTPIAVGMMLLILRATRKWKWSAGAALGVALTLAGFFATLAEARQFQTTFRRNQTLQPFALVLRENYRPGDMLICWGRLPEGLPFYAAPVIAATNRPYIGGMDLTQVPFEFPGNRGRLGDWYLPGESALRQRLTGQGRVWFVCPDGTLENLRQSNPAVPLHLVARVGQWELFSNR